MDDWKTPRELPWGGDPKASWTPEQRQDWSDAEAELYESGYRPPQPVCELPDCTTIDREITVAELRLADREVRGLADEEDRATVYELQRARGRLN